ncbi:hypothetical protein CEXT_42301 [Caerostris extrusa]|uniref:Uncharacterized protein n=1 Tax=Caerostris extrusa TaxID=172846 RepID=A0AAV4PPX1_CAEEX|nr:hypothetical protein CEXT_42301 [Caerostris extrusa]
MEALCSKVSPSVAMNTNDLGDRYAGLRSKPPTKCQHDTKIKINMKQVPAPTWATASTVDQNRGLKIEISKYGPPFYGIGCARDEEGMDMEKNPKIMPSYLINAKFLMRPRDFKHECREAEFCSAYSLNHGGMVTANCLNECLVAKMVPPLPFRFPFSATLHPQPSALPSHHKILFFLKNHSCLSPLPIFSLPPFRGWRTAIQWEILLRNRFVLSLCGVWAIFEPKKRKEKIQSYLCHIRTPFREERSSRKSNRTLAEIRQAPYSMEKKREKTGAGEWKKERTFSGRKGAPTSEVN